MFHFLWRKDFKMKTKLLLSISLFFALNVAIAQSDIKVSINKSDAGETNSYGSAALTITGGVAPYYVLWSNGSTKTKVEKLLPGDYLVRISDSKGNTIERKFKIEDKSVTVQNTTNP